MGDFFQEEEKGVEVDAENDGEGDEGVFDGKPGEAGRAEFALLATNGREEVGFGVGEVVDVDGPVLRRLADAEVEGIVGIGEGGDVEVFGDGVIESAFSVGFAEGEEFHLAVGVGDFGDGGDGFFAATVDIVERNRIEGVTEDTGKSDELDDRIGWNGGVFFREPCDEVFANGFLRIGVDVITVVDGEEVEAILGEEGDVREMIEIDGEHEHAVGERVFFGGDACVGNLALVDEIFHRRGAEAGEECRVCKI